MLVEDVIADGAIEPQYRPTSIEFGPSPSLTSTYEEEQEGESWMSKLLLNARLIALVAFWS